MCEHSCRNDRNNRFLLPEDEQNPGHSSLIVLVMNNPSRNVPYTQHHKRGILQAFKRSRRPSHLHPIIANMKRRPASRRTPERGSSRSDGRSADRFANERAIHEEAAELVWSYLRRVVAVHAHLLDNIRNDPCFAFSMRQPEKAVGLAGVSPQYGTDCERKSRGCLTRRVLSLLEPGKSVLLVPCEITQTRTMFNDGKRHQHMCAKYLPDRRRQPCSGAQSNIICLLYLSQRCEWATHRH